MEIFETMSRRDSLRRMGAAGLGMVASGGKRVRAEVGRMKPSDFTHRYRTFGPDETIRLGMIGTVGHVSTILRDLPSMEHIKLVACSNMDNPNLDLPEGVRIYDTYEEMLDGERLDLVGVCLPYYLNAKASTAAAERGIHVITEKPVATTLEDLVKLKETVAGNGVRLTALLSMRMEPRFQAVYKAVGEGAVGEPILATAQKSYKFGKSRPDFYRDLRTYGGTIPWVGIHAIDYIHFTTRLDYTEVVAFQGNKDHPDYPGCQDYAGMLFRMSNGGTAMVNLDYLRPETAPTHGDDRLRIIGSEGVVEIKDLGARVELITSGREPYDLPLPEGKSFMRDFIDELRGRGKHVLSPEEPFEMTRVALLARLSAEEGKIITL